MKKEEIISRMKETVENESGYIVQAGNLSFMVHGPAVGLTAGMKKYVRDVYVPELAFFNVGDFWKVFYSRKETKEVANFYLNKALTNYSYIKEKYKEYEDLILRMEDFAWDIREKSLSEFSEDKLKENIKKASNLLEEAWANSFFVEAYDEDTEKRVEDFLDKKGLDINKEELDILFSPDHSTFLMNYRSGAIKWLLNPDKEKLHDLIREYFFIKVDYGQMKEVGPETIKKEFFSQIKNQSLKEELDKIEKKVEELKALRRIIRKVENKYDMDEETKNFFEFFRLLIKWRDERKKVNQLGMYVNWISIKELFRRKGINEKLVKYAVVPEILQGKYKEEGYQKILQKRKEGALVYYTAEGKFSWIYDMDKIREIERIVEGELSEGIKEIKGQIANKGKVKGRVKIVNYTNQFHKVEEGDILVASMTRPEYGPLLSRVSAIITDEGGITSHAAIVSREMNIPCIIGTKIATRVLKDGQLVELDAEKGIVRILNKKD